MTKLLFTCYISILLVITPDTDDVIDNTVVSSDKVVCVADNAAVSVDNVVVAADNITDDNISAYHVVSLLIYLLFFFIYISDNVVIASDDCVVILDHVIGILLFSSSFCCVCSFYLVTHIYSRYSVVCCFKYHLLSLLLFSDIFFSILITVSVPV